MHESIEIEKAILGAILHDPSAETYNILKETSLEARNFSSNANQHIYDAILDLYETGIPVEQFNLSQRLKEKGKLESIGGYVYVSSLTDNIATAATLSFHISIIKNNYLYTRLLNLLLTATKTTNGNGTRPPAIDFIKDLFDKINNDIIVDNQLNLSDNSGYQQLLKLPTTTENKNIAAEVRDYCMATNGYFSATNDYFRLLTATNKKSAIQNKKAILAEILKLVKKGILEHHPSQSGIYRLKNQREDVEIDYLNADIRPLDIKFPLEAHEYFQIHRGNVVMVAGESNAGKTSFLLNVAYKNKDKMDMRVNYMSSEMQDGAELRIRLNEFEHAIESWQRIKFTFRTDNFPEKIIPEGINIIDYLDEGKDAEAYKMAGRIRDIADKLTTGIAIIAIQKDPNKQFGFGGSGTLNRARVYITLQKSGLLKIEKAKIWKNKTTNPNGMGIKFKLIGGAKFMQATDWLTQEEVKDIEFSLGGNYGRK